MTAGLSASSGPSAPGVSELAAEHRAWLTGWFETYLTHDRFTSSSDEDLAALLAPTVERIVAEVIAASGVVVPAAEVERSATRFEAFAIDAMYRSSQGDCSEDERAHLAGIIDGWQSAAADLRALVARLAGEGR